MNTVFEYLYRDASSYKEWGSIVFAGELTGALRERSPTDAFGRSIEHFVCEVESAGAAGWRDFDPLERRRGIVGK